MSEAVEGDSEKGNKIKIYKWLSIKMRNFRLDM